LTLPLHITLLFGPPSIETPIVWLLGVLVVSIGLPFAILSASAPLLQAWFARSETPLSGLRNPYVLYAASNIGSLAALLAYPAGAEPLVSLHMQAKFWTVGYAVFCVAVAALGILISRGSVVSQAVQDNVRETAKDAPNWRARILWLLLAAVPSSLMLGATTCISDDVASVPFLWVIPLALYLLTFIIAFRPSPAMRKERALLWQTVFVPMAAAILCVNTGSLVAHTLVYLGAFFFSALVCHQRLFESRPSPSHLTEFYVLVSLGGVLGGMFNVLLAPQLFASVAEFPLVLALATLARPGFTLRFNWREMCFALTGLAAAIALCVLPGGPATTYLPIAFAVTAAGAAAFVSGRTLLFATVIGCLSAEAMFLPPDRHTNLAASRTFFGVYRVTGGNDAALGHLHLMFHGTTIHGAQPLATAHKCDATTYYAAQGPIGQVFSRVLSQRPAARIAAVGLGVGTVAAYTRPGDVLRFFEIDPEVERIARDRRYFSYLSGCARGKVGVVLGDARLSLEKDSAHSYDLVLLDAFSADSVPTHLLTAEAFRLYLQLLKPEGLLLVHISNRNLELEPSVAATARAVGAPALVQYFMTPRTGSGIAASPTEAMLIAPSARAITPFARDCRWLPTHDHGVRPWSDDYSNVFGALLARAFAR
jgi:predicted O-methyltransferase YrrM